MRFTSLFAAASRLGGNMLTAATKYIPAELSEDKRYANAYAAILASLVAADFEIEEDETIAALNHIQSDADLLKNGLVSHTLGFYAQFIEEFAACNGAVPQILVARAQILEKNVRCIANGSHKFALYGMAKSLVGVQANVQEKQVLAEVQNILL